MRRSSADDSGPRLVASRDAGGNTGNAVDAALVARIGAGDRLALRVLYTRHHARMRRFVRRFVDNEALADDLMHEAFLYVWRNAAGFAGRGPVSTWLLCVARHRTIQAARSSDRHLRCQGAATPVSSTDHNSTEGRVS